MTAVLKAALAGANVRSFGSHADARVPDESQRALDAALESLGRAEERIAELEEACLEARREGERDGFERGRSAAEDSRAEQLEMLQTAIDTAQSTFTSSLSSVDVLAASMARSCLEAIIGDPAHYSDLVTRALRNQLNVLDSSSILQVSVSPRDFPDAEALELLTGSSGATIVADPGLSSGECRIALQLGSLDIGPGTQWGRLGEALAELAGVAE